MHFTRLFSSSLSHSPHVKNATHCTIDVTWAEWSVCASRPRWSNFPVLSPVSLSDSSPCQDTVSSLSLHLPRKPPSSPTLSLPPNHHSLHLNLNLSFVTSKPAISIHLLCRVCQYTSARLHPSPPLPFPSLPVQRSFPTTSMSSYGAVRITDSQPPGEFLYSLFPPFVCVFLKRNDAFLHPYPCLMLRDMESFTARRVFIHSSLSFPCYFFSFPCVFSFLLSMMTMITSRKRCSGYLA